MTKKVIVYLECRDNQKFLSVCAQDANNPDNCKQSHYVRYCDRFHLFSWLRENTNKSLHQDVFKQLSDCIDIAKQRKKLIEHVSRQNKQESGWLR